MIKLYSQFLKAEKSGNFERDTELGRIKEKYEAEFALRAMFVLQVELTHVISDRWYNEKLKNNTIN
ncbi:hypothetical protein DXA10_06880 [Firmicutes bacterium AM55-24TS]|nr:hypothetical protein DXA10_06880 [Firmicutes bacterium AM55-24TS]